MSGRTSEKTKKRAAGNGEPPKKSGGPTARKGKPATGNEGPAAKRTHAPDRMPPAEQRETVSLPQPPSAARRIVVVGGGASGMAAAIAAAREANGVAQVILLEKQARVGRKLLATGNGRCNLGHTPLTADHYVSGDRAALEAFLQCRARSDPAALWHALGLLCREEEGRIYPYSNQASGVLDILRDAMQQDGVLQYCGVAVRSVRKQADGFLLQLTQTQPEDTAPTVTLYADRLILACGGADAPALGGGMDGFALAGSLGHGCTALLPGLTGVIGTWQDEAGDPVREMGGLLRGVRAHAAATLFDAAKSDGPCLASDTGELQFNEDGISGIPVLQLSLRLQSARRPVIALDLLPQLAEKELEALLLQRLDRCPDAETLFLGTIHKRLVQALCRCTGIALHDTLTPDGAQRLARAAKDLQLAVTGTAGWAGAQTTVGGVPLAEAAPETCASLRCPGLYLTGELLDAAGECGGFNLDWAFSTGLRAGRAAARSF